LRTECIVTDLSDFERYSDAELFGT
jgi:hypothetical protein